MLPRPWTVLLNDPVVEVAGELTDLPHDPAVQVASTPQWQPAPVPVGTNREMLQAVVSRWQPMQVYGAARVLIPPPLVAKVLRSLSAPSSA